MAKPLIISPQAQRDFDNAYLWYEKKYRGLGKEFARCVDAKIALIHRSPCHFQIIYNDLVRRALVSHFPFAIYFVEKPEVVSIFAILRQCRNPESWISRT